MTFLKSKKRFGQFETLETKKLFAADLAASADVVSISPGDCSSAFTAAVTDSAFKEMHVHSNGFQCYPPLASLSSSVPEDLPSLGGQEGEPISDSASDIVLANLGNLQNYCGGSKSSPAR